MTHLENNENILNDQIISFVFFFLQKEPNEVMNFLARLAHTTTRLDWNESRIACLVQLVITALKEHQYQNNVQGELLMMYWEQR